MTNNDNKPWHKNASNYLLVNSIFAAISAVILQTFITEQRTHSVIWLLFGVGALFLFVLSAEKITEAVQDDNVRQYIRYFLPYNVGVGFLFIDAVGLIRHYGKLSIFWTIIVFIPAIIVWCVGWGCDTWFQPRKDANFDLWKKQLLGEDVNVEIEDPCDRCWRWLKARIRRQEPLRTLPHKGVYTRLQPSVVHGVGVFAIEPIRRGTSLFDRDEKIVWVPRNSLVNLSPALQRLYEDFAIIQGDRYGCPENFNRLTMGWYLNDSDYPNVAVDSDFNMYAIRDIAEGEELTIDSSKFSVQPYKTQRETQDP